MVVRRRLVAVILFSLVLVPFAVSQSGRSPDRQWSSASACLSPAQPIQIGRSFACTHSDEAPAGVDVTDHVSTAALAQRPGAGATAYAAAQQLGVAATPVQLATTATSPAVTCDGDGTSGYRVQAMYVVEAGATNRYASLLPSFQLWAAGTDDVVNRSAALTGGVRHIRYVTDPGANGTCVADVLNVTVPAGSLANFSATINAVQALGYTNPARKYLMWTDASVLCGIASMYPGDGATQANPNNGSYPQYARVDSGCWGLGNGSNQHSVEAHELLHTLGGVQNSAPHSTNAGHCWDESDTMCYADGGTHAMQQICPAEREYLYDCNSDDYFSTFPDPGSYLSGHWDAASSRFLIGGGDGTGGGTLGTPTTLGATIAVNNPAVPGLSTQASVAPSLPVGRTLTSVKWKSARTDCVFGTPADVQTTVTCSAVSAAGTTVTATLTDSTGAIKVISSPLTFSSGTARPVALSLAAASQSTDAGSTASVCTGAAFPLVAQVTDVATGSPVLGLSVIFRKQTATMTAPATTGSGASTIAGAATSSQVTTVSAAYSAATTAGTVYAAGASPVLTAAPDKCTPSLTGAADLSTIYYADPVTVSGTLTRTVGASTVPVAGAALPVKVSSGDGATLKVQSLGTAVTAADGSYRLVVKPTMSGTITVELPASTAYNPTKVVVGPVTVNLPNTTLTAAVDKTDVGYGKSIVVSGTLKRDAGGVITALKGSSVGINVTPDGKPAVRIGAATVLADGSYTVSVPLRYSGALSAVYAGAAGQPAASVALGPVVAGTWTTALTASASATAVPLLGSVTISGTVTRSYAGSTEPAPSLRVNVYFTATGTTTRVLMAGLGTSATGGYTVKLFPKGSGFYTVVLADTPGYTAASSDPLPITVG